MPKLNWGNTKPIAPVYTDHRHNSLQFAEENLSSMPSGDDGKVDIDWTAGLIKEQAERVTVIGGVGLFYAQPEYPSLQMARVWSGI